MVGAYKVGRVWVGGKGGGCELGLHPVPGRAALRAVGWCVGGGIGVLARQDCARQAMPQPLTAALPSNTNAANKQQQEYAGEYMYNELQPAEEEEEGEEGGEMQA